MNKILIAAFLVGMSGAAAIAQEAALNPARKAPTLSELQIRPLPVPLQALIKRLQIPATKLDPATPNIQSFVQSSDTQIKTFVNNLTEIMKKKGYDPDVEQLVFIADNQLDQAKKALNALKPVENSPAEIAENLAIVQEIINALNAFNPPPPSTFPGKCINYRENPLHGGNIEYSAGRQWVYTILIADKVMYYPISKEAGFMDGNSYIPSRGSTKTVYLDKSQDAKGAQVVCVEP